jgi:hypothetical protein
MKSQECKAMVTVVEPSQMIPVVVPPTVQPEVKESAGRFVADIGFFNMKDPTNFMPLRAGYQFPIGEKVWLNFMGGVFINLSNNSIGTPVVADATVVFAPSSFWIAGGTGLWAVKNHTQLDFIGNIGFEIFSGEKLGGSLFLEARVGTKDFDAVGDFARFGLGFRLHF